MGAVRRTCVAQGRLCGLSVAERPLVAHDEDDLALGAFFGGAGAGVDACEGVAQSCAAGGLGAGCGSADGLAGWRGAPGGRCCGLVGRGWRSLLRLLCGGRPCRLCVQVLVDGDVHVLGKVVVAIKGYIVIWRIGSFLKTGIFEGIGGFGGGR